MKRNLYLLIALICVSVTKTVAQVSVASTGGTTAASYTTLGGTFTAINAGTHTGAITVNITANTTEAGTCTLNSSGSGSASYTSVLIKPTTAGVTITGSTTSGLIVLNGADNVTIDGAVSAVTNTVCPRVTSSRNLTITNTNTGTASAVIWMQTTGTNGATDNTIRNCNISGNSNAQTLIGIGSGGTTISITSAGNGNSNNRIENNSIRAVQTGIYSMGTNATKNQNNVIILNSMTDNTATGCVRNNGILVGFENNILISGNTIADATTTISQDYVGINVGIANNGIANTTSSGNDVTNAIVTNNSLSNIYKNASWGMVGIAVITPSTGTNLVANNMLSKMSGSATSPDMSAGILVVGSSTTGTTNIYSNTVNVGGAFGGSQAFPAIGVAGSNPVVNIKNNIVVVNPTTANAMIRCIALGYSTFTNLTSDYNSFYTNGANFSLTGALTTSGTSQATLAAWQALTGKDANSILFNPTVVSATDFHLQPVPANVPLIAGVSGTGITTDIDCGTRSTTTPIIGAHEVNIPVCMGTPTAGTVTATVASGCATYSSVLSLPGATLAAGISYQWQSSPDSLTYTDITGATTSTYTATVSDTIYYRAKITCSTSALFDYTPGKLLMQYPNPSAITGIGSTCIGGTMSLSSATPGGTWTSGTTAVATIGSSTGVVTAVTAGTTNITYTITATGCRTSAVITVAPTPSAFTITPNSSDVCASGPAQKLVSSSSVISNNGTFGTQANVNGTTAYPAPLSRYYGGQRCQFLMLASELSAKGYMAGSRLTGMTMQVLTLGSSAPYVLNSYQVRIIPTTVTALSSFLTTGMVTAMSATDITPVVGNNTLTFTNPYTWDGTSNLVFDLTFGTGTSGTTAYSATMYNTNTSFVSTIVYRRDGATAGTAAAAASATAVDLSYSQRPDFTLLGTNPTTKAWAPLTGLYTDAAATIPYTGTAADSVYALPSANTTYTTTATYMTCINTATASVNVNPLPAVIGGSASVCPGTTTTLTNADAGGAWSSSNPGVATVGSANGVVTGVTPGTAAISYTFTSTGCSRVKIVTVNPLPGAITGTASVCQGSSTTLGNPDGGGMWSAGSTSIATVGATTGIVTGVGAGLTIVTYTLPTACISTIEVTVNPLPVNTVTPTTSTICFGDSVSFTGSSSLAEFSILNQDFNTGLSGWTITNLFGADTSYWKIRAMDVTSGATGDGTPMMSATPFEYAGVTHTILTSPSFSTIGYGSASLSFNQNLFSLVSADIMVAVEYSIDGGVTWDTVLDQVDVTSGTGTWSASSPEVTVALPGDALGQGDVRLRWNYNSNFGLWWDIDNIAVKAAQAPATPTWAGVGGATGLSCDTCATTVITPAASGANVYEFTAVTTTGCMATTAVTVNVNPLPATIGGTLSVCLGLTTSLSNTDAGGTWSSSDASIASIGTTGIVSGNAVGTATITYTLTTGCFITAVVTVNPLPVAIGGTLSVCHGLTTTLTNSDAGGSWSSSDASIASIDAAGVVTGVLPGAAVITYTLPTTCIATSVVTVNPLPAAITGTLEVCEGLSTSLFDAAAGGTWSSGDNAIATIGATTGVATGVLAGTVSITYTLPTGCIATDVLTVNPLPTAITGTLDVCVGETTTLNNTTTGGAWSSGTPSIAIIEIATGIVTGLSAGTTLVTYTLLTGCLTTEVVTVDPLPAVYSVTATSGGVYCADDAGVNIILTGSQTGISYQLYNVGGTIGAPIAGTGFSLDFGVQPAGTYSVLATNTVTLCTKVMGSTTVTVNPTPAVYTVTGGGSYCAGGTGVAIGLSGSQTGKKYQLYVGGSASGTAVVGTGFAVSFGLRTVAGTYTVIATDTTTGCTSSMTGSATVIISPVPAAYSVTGGGAYCAGGTGVNIGLSNSQTGVSYQLYNGGTAVGGFVTGTGSPISFGLQTGVGTYSVIANPGSTCATVMTGTTTVAINPLPTAYNVTGGGSYCTGGSGVHIGLSNSTGGVSCRLYNGATPVGTAVYGTGAAIDFGLFTATGTYTVSAMDTTTTCTDAMNGSVDVNISSAPVVYTVTGGGTYCSGGSGVSVGLNNSQAGVSYQLYNGSTAVGGLVTGTGGALSFGLITGAGTYSVVANPGSSCATNMTGTATVAINPAPVAYNVTGGGSYCVGGSGVHVGLSTSAVGVDYQLYNGTSPVGAVVAGTGAALDFGLQTATGTYTVNGVSTANGCVTDMAGMTTVNVSTSVNVFSVTGGGAYCAGGTGVHIGLSSSDAGASYQLYNGAAAVGGFVTGTGGAIDFGTITGAGTYSVVANPGSTCATDMTGAATITINALPVAYNVTGGGSYCEGGTGVAVGLSNSAGSVKYQLYYGSSVLGATVAGTGAAISFGSQTMAGVYTVMATDTVTTCANAMAGSAVITVNPVLIPSITVSATSTTVCAGTDVTFNAAVVNGGAVPVYIWRVNGTVAGGATSSTYTYTPANGDVVTGKLISTATCAIPDSSVSSITMTVNPLVTPAVTINATPGGHLCPGTGVTLTATTVNEGPTPAYRWVVNSATVGTAISHSYVPVNGDIVYFMLASTANCITPGDSIVFSNNIIMAVDSAWVPVVTVTVTPGTHISTGETATFTAAVTNAGPTPTYQWYKNGVVITGATNATYVSSTIANNDSMSCIVIGSGACGYSSFNSVIMKVAPVKVQQLANAADIRLVPNPNKGMFTVKGSLSSEGDEEVTIEIVNMLGQKVYSGRTMAKGGKVNEQIQLSNTLANGMYMLNLRSGDEQSVFHFVLEQ